MLTTAQALARSGIAIFPCQQQSKVPATAHGLKDATTDADRIGAWWHENSQYNIGVATGACSRFFAVDVDGGGGEASLARLESQFEPLPSSIETITPGGPGRHIWFR